MVLEENSNDSDENETDKQVNSCTTQSSSILNKAIKNKEVPVSKEEIMALTTQKYYVGPGNNCQVIKNAMKSRTWWS
jgi:hypothetical protein